MTFLQFGIGATNDVVDAPHDAGRKPGKPIPAGLVWAGAARFVAVVAFLAGLSLSAPSSPALVALAVVVIAIGLAYDLRLKGTAWSWLPFAAGIPLLPVFGWVGAGAALPVAFAVLVPAAVAAGAALAVGNAAVDVERDRSAGVGSVAVRLGRWADPVAVGLVTLVVAAAAVSAALFAPPVPAVAVAAAGAVPLAATLAGWGGGPVRREWAWRVEAVGFAVLAIAWLGAVLPPG